MSCKHVVQSPYGVAIAGTAEFAPCPWCRIEALENEPTYRIRQEQAERIEELESKLDTERENYDAAARHADRGWTYLKQAVAALYRIAQPERGAAVTGSFDEPGSATIAREAISNLPSAGAYEGRPPWPPEGEETDQSGPCGAMYSDDSRSYCRLENDHEGPHEMVKRR